MNPKLAAVIIASCVFALRFSVVHASIAFGDLNNFDCVNDTGVEAHGFEIELDDVQSKDITYTYDYNHYGIPKITQDTTDPLHPKVFVRYAGARNPDGTWTAYTAIPAGPITPTQGHQFTNPSVNFGGEHFGVGYYGTPTAVKYNWLIDDLTPSHNLIHGPPVYVATPTFVYNPPVAAAPAFVQAVIVPPPPPAPPVLQFGQATWVKEIKTSTHNANKVELVDLVDPDPADPLAANWANGEPAEVEVEWQLLQTEFANAANPKGVLQGANEDLPGGDEVITRRYEFYKYTGPLDAETGEAVGETVAADGLHGSGSVTYADHFDPAIGDWVTVTVDTSTLVIVGDFFGAQMAGFDVAPALGLIDHLQDGDLNQPYVERTVVIGGNPPYLATIATGSLPNGMVFDQVTGVLSGTPTESGVFPITIDAEDLVQVLVTKAYTLTILAPVVAPPPTITCPPDVTVNNDPGQCSAVVNYAAPTTTGNGVTVVCNPASGSSFPVGTTTVNCTATDAANLTATCSFNVTVDDAEPPTITLVGNNPLTWECHTVFDDPGITVTDNCPGHIDTSANYDGLPINSPSSFAIIYTATDLSGNTAIATKTVNVVDSVAPLIVLNGANPLTIPCQTPFTDPGATASDACAGNVAVTVSGAVDVNATGDYTLTYLAADPSGNVATTTRTVTVVCGGGPPTIGCPADLTVSNDPGQCSAVVNYPLPSVSGGTAPYQLVCNPPSGAAFPVGVTTVNCIATDASGNTAACSFNVTVQDLEGPTISSVTATPSILRPINNRMTPVKLTVSATDNCGGPVTSTIVSITCTDPIIPLPNGRTEPYWLITGNLNTYLRAGRNVRGVPRIYTLTVECKDAAGNASTQTVAVTVPK